MDTEKQYQTFNNAEGYPEAHVEKKSVDSYFSEMADETLKLAVDKIHLDVSGKNFDFRAGWETTGAYISVRLHGISPAKLWKAAAVAIVLFLLGWAGRGGVG